MFSNFKYIFRKSSELEFGIWGIVSQQFGPFCDRDSILKVIE